jgi:AraC family transcriptional activator of mtrCDE
MMIDHGRGLVASRLFRLTENGSQRWQNGVLPRQRLNNAVDAIVANPEQVFTFVDLARLCHASVFHFARSFTAHLGCAPFAVQRNRRMQRAKERLLDTELSIEAIGHAVGIETRLGFRASSGG